MIIDDNNCQSEFEINSKIMIPRRLKFKLDLPWKDFCASICCLDVPLAIQRMYDRLELRQPKTIWEATNILCKVNGHEITPNQRWNRAEANYKQTGEANKEKQVEKREFQQQKAQRRQPWKKNEQPEGKTNFFHEPTGQEKKAKQVRALQPTQDEQDEAEWTDTEAENNKEEYGLETPRGPATAKGSVGEKPLETRTIIKERHRKNINAVQLFSEDSSEEEDEIVNEDDGECPTL